MGLKREADGAFSSALKWMDCQKKCEKGNVDCRNIYAAFIFFLSTSPNSTILKTG